MPARRFGDSPRLFRKNEATPTAPGRVDRAGGEVTLGELLAELPPEQVAAIDRHYHELRAGILAAGSPTRSDSQGEPGLSGRDLE